MEYSGCVRKMLSSRALMELVLALVNLAINLLSPLWHLVVYLFQFHAFMICELFDPVKEDSSLSSKFTTGNVHFVFPLVSFIFGHLFGMFGLDEKCESILQVFNLERVRSSPYTMVHQIFQRHSWRYMDLCMGLFTACLVIALYGAMFATTQVGPEFFLYLRNNSSRKNYYAIKPKLGLF